MQKVEIELTGEPSTTMFCFCLDCQQLSGSVGQLISIFPKTAVKINGSDDVTQLDVFENDKTASGKPRQDYRCKNCGGQLMLSSDNFPGIYGLKLFGLLGIDTNKYAPEKAVYTKDRCQWAEKLLE